MIKPVKRVEWSPDCIDLWSVGRFINRIAQLLREMSDRLDVVSAPIKPGSLLCGRYKVLSKVGAGSTASVYLCRDTESLGKRVAVKVLTPRLLKVPAARVEFLREYLIGCSLSHPNLVQYYDTVREGDTQAFSMEYIDGGSLSKFIAKGIQLPIPDVLELLREILSALSLLHSRNIIHHDLKPSNILLTSRRSVKISDFGISRFSGQQFEEESSRRVGTPLYISPEYLTEGSVSKATDLYSVGIVAYELLTGYAPFVGKGVFETITLRFHDRPDPVHRHRSDCSPRLSAVIEKAMALDPSDRYADAKEMEQALIEAVHKSAFSFFSRARPSKPAPSPRYKAIIKPVPELPLLDEVAQEKQDTDTIEMPFR